jgi:hypothetical protein
MNKKANDTIDEVTRFLKLVNKHLNEKNCKHTMREVAKEFVDSRINSVLTSLSMAKRQFSKISIISISVPLHILNIKTKFCHGKMS